MSETLKRHPLVWFFVLAYAGTWLVRSPIWLSHNGLGVLPYEIPPGPASLLFAVGPFAGPFLAAWVMTRATEGEEGVRRWLRRLLQWRGNGAWYAVSLLVIPLTIVAVVMVWPGHPAWGSVTVPLVVQYLVMWLPYLVLGGPLGEEAGWRGYALPRLQELLAPLPAALLLGVMWCFWHLPNFFIRDWDTARGNVVELVAYFVAVVAMSVVMSWVTNGARGSLVIACLAHNSVNVAVLFMGSLSGEATSNIPVAVALVAVALVAVASTRGRLGVARHDSASTT